MSGASRLGLAACGVPRTLQERTRRHAAEALEMPREMALVEEADFRRHDRSRHARKQQRLCAPDAHAAKIAIRRNPNCCRNTVAKRDTLSADSSASCASRTGSSKCASMNARASSRAAGGFMAHHDESTDVSGASAKRLMENGVERYRRAAGIDEFGERLADARADLKPRAAEAERVEEPVHFRTRADHGFRVRQIAFDAAPHPDHVERRQRGNEPAELRDLADGVDAAGRRRGA